MCDILTREKKWEERYFNLKFREMIKPYLRGSKKHLDFGCGFGCFAYLLSKDYPRMKVIGTDIDKEAIREGRKRYKRKNLKLVATDKIIGKYTSISCCFTLHELTNPKKYIKEFYRHLENDGIILVYDLRKVSKKKFIKWYSERKYIQESFEETYRKHCKWTPKELAKIFEKSGFKTLEVRSISDYWCFYVGKKVS
jgi:ubiquinone/menaquinone biosynthesis C-methylase UbiE